MNFNGLILGVLAFFIIGIFHPIVVKCEYYFSEKAWPVFLVSGLLSGIFSLIVEDFLLSGFWGILACVLLWCIRELKEQTKRVERGWFPKNPARQNSLSKRFEIIDGYSLGREDKNL